MLAFLIVLTTSFLAISRAVGEKYFVRQASKHFIPSCLLEEEDVGSGEQKKTGESLRNRRQNWNLGMMNSRTEYFISSVVIFVLSTFFFFSFSCFFFKNMVLKKNLAKAITAYHSTSKHFAI